MKHLVAIGMVEVVVTALYFLTMLTGPHLYGNESLIVWLIAGAVVGYFGSPYPRRWWEERSRERSHSR